MANNLGHFHYALCTFTLQLNKSLNNRIFLKFHQLYFFKLKNLKTLSSLYAKRAITHYIEKTECCTYRQ